MAKFNGWTNHETWLTNLHFECFDFNDFLAEIDEACESMADVTDWIANYIESTVTDVVEEQIDISSNSFITDCIRSFVDDIDWHEIADHYTEDVMQAIIDKKEDHKEQLRLAHAYWFSTQADWAGAMPALGIASSLRH